MHDSYDSPAVTPQERTSILSAPKEKSCRFFEVREKSHCGCTCKPDSCATPRCERLQIRSIVFNVVFCAGHDDIRLKWVPGREHTLSVGERGQQQQRGIPSPCPARAPHLQKNNPANHTQDPQAPLISPHCYLVGVQISEMKSKKHSRPADRTTPPDRLSITDMGLYTSYRGTQRSAIPVLV